MNRRDFLKVSGTGMLTLFLSGCGLSMLNNDKPAQSNMATTEAATISEGGKQKMKIVVLAGSPHRRGTSALLADKFIEGAQSGGHEIFRFNAAFEDIHPCQGCDVCGMNGHCVQKDAIENELMPHLLAADLIVLITPLYYYGMSAQLKTVIDRFYSHSGAISGKRSMLMATAYNSADWTMEALVHHYETLVRYMRWQDMGKVLAVGCGSRSVIEGTAFPQQAYELGRSL
ncbi:flavodoxin family protein [Phascolarctobacterium sp.]